MPGHRHAGYHRHARPHGRQAAQPVHEVCRGDGFAVGLVQQQGGFGKIGGDDVCLAHQPAHALHHLHVHGGFQLAVVAQNRVHHGKAAFHPAHVDAPGHDVHLRRRTQKAAVHRVELQVQGLPVVQEQAHLVGKVQKAVAGEARRVGGQHGGGHGAHLRAHGGQYGNGHGERGAAKAGKIVDGRHARHGIAHCRAPCAGFRTGRVRPPGGHTITTERGKRQGGACVGGKEKGAPVGTPLFINDFMPECRGLRST
ncbi:hypothetical protein DSECCO2_644720 [anaerobic digester metagenome]